jgi:ATP-binding cassette subfamily B protein
VIEQGRIAEMGSHAELIRQRGHYYRLYTRQFRQEMEQQVDVFQSYRPVLPQAALN